MKGSLVGKRPYEPTTEVICETHLSQGKADQLGSNLSLESRTPFIHLFSQRTRQRKYRVQCNSHLRNKGFPYLDVSYIEYWMTGISNGNTPKVYLHDQEMTKEDVDRTSIFLNPAKSRTVRRMAIKNGGKQ